MSELLVLRDPALEVIDFLSEYLGRDVGPDVPGGFKWGAGRYVVVQDSGGLGERDVVLDVAFVTVRVYHRTQHEASTLARETHGLIRRWANSGKGRPAWDGTVERPTWDPDPETGTPGYTMVVRLIFRARVMDEPTLPW